MANAQFTVGDAWTRRFLSGMDLVSRFAHYDLPRVSESNLDVDYAVATLNSLARGRFQTSDRLGEREQGRPQPPTEPPQIDISARYSLFALNALTAKGEFVSSPTGGICFEDPFWAVLSAAALAQKKLTALPKAGSNAELWRNSSIVNEAVRAGDYGESSFFQEIKGWISPAEFPTYETKVVRGEQLAALRDRGFQTLEGTTPPRFYELYTVPRR